MSTFRLLATSAVVVATLLVASPAFAVFVNFRGSAVLEFDPAVVCRDGVAGLVLSEGTEDDPHQTFRFDDITAATPPPEQADPEQNPYPDEDTIVATGDITLAYVHGGVEVDEDNDGNVDEQRRYYRRAFELRWQHDGRAVTLPVGTTVELDVDEGQVAGPSQALLEVRDCFLDTTRISGSTRWATAVAISQRTYPDADSAGAVVLARGDDPDGFPDALSGAPLAAQVDAPMLLTRPERMPDETTAEIDRVLPAGGTVYVLGGTAAVSAEVTDGLKQRGYRIDRIRGHDRIGTALAVAERLGDPRTLLITSGDTFPDALAAAPAAVASEGAVLLIRSEQRSAAVDDYLERHPDADLYAVGGLAARPYPEATPLYGRDRVATSVAVAERFFPHPDVVGVARSDAFPDSLSGGAHVGRLGGPLLLTPTASLADAVGSYVCHRTAGLGHGFLYGGPAAVSDEVRVALGSRISGVDCP